MKIGILTYHAPCNFGANLQAYTTLKIFSSYGHDAWVINYERADDINPSYCDVRQQSAHVDFVKQHLNLTRPVHNGKELSELLKENKFDIVVVGADAVWNKRITEDLLLFTGDWLDEELAKKVKLVALSPAFMGRTYADLNEELKKRVAKNLQKFSYIAVRDSWTRSCLNNDIFRSEYIKNINPDPVVNINCFLSDRIVRKPIGIESKKYIIMSLPTNWLVTNYSKRRQWFENFKELTHSAGLKLVELPLPDGVSGLDFDYTIPYPIDPLDWYCWIRDAYAFCGLRFHAIVSCISAGTPFFSVDAYGKSNIFISVLKRLGLHKIAGNFDKNSKIWNLLEGSEFSGNRIGGALEFYPANRVFKKLISTSKADVESFRDILQSKYKHNISEMFSIIGKTSHVDLKILSLEESCTGCAACVNACPQKAIKIGEHNQGFYYPELDVNKCISCNLCEKACPELNKQDYLHMQKAYYGWTQNEDDRRNSSSGGVFSLVAKRVLENGGVVYGMAFNYTSDHLRLDCLSTDEVSLAAIQKSKYVQGYIGNAFSRIKHDLISGKQVLFCGTPCQVAGLKQYLHKDYENLITCDFVCHGVASMDMLRKHLNYRRIHNESRIDFRPKTRGSVSDIIIEFGSKKRYIERVQHDVYMFNFYNNNTLRKSCYNCHYCNGNRMADISLADFWGYRRFDPSIGDAKGLSLILANSNEGISILDSIMSSEGAMVKELDSKYATYVYDTVRTEKDSRYDIEKRNTIIDAYYSMSYHKATQLTGFKINWIKFIYDHIMFNIKKL